MLQKGYHADFFVRRREIWALTAPLSFRTQAKDLMGAKRRKKKPPLEHKGGGTNEVSDGGIVIRWGYYLLLFVFL